MTDSESLKIVNKLHNDYPKQFTLKPSEFIDFYWKKYKEMNKNNPSLNGKVFEQLIISLLERENITPFYVQAEVTFVPNAIFDILLYSEKKTYTLSVKTSLRERWKQADLEALALKNVLKNSICLLVTLSKDEVQTRRKKDEYYNGLDGFVLATDTELDDLIDKLKQKQFEESRTFSVIKKSSSKY